MTPICRGRRLIRVICFSNYRYRTHLPKPTHRPEVPHTQVHTYTHTSLAPLDAGVLLEWKMHSVLFFHQLGSAFIYICKLASVFHHLLEALNLWEGEYVYLPLPRMHLSHRLAPCAELYEWQVKLGCYNFATSWIIWANICVWRIQMVQDELRNVR